MELDANTPVRLKSEPTRIGQLTGQQRPGHPGRGPRLQVRFPDLSRYVPVEQLEPVPHHREGPVELMEKAKLGRPEDLRRTLTHVRLTGRLADVIYSMETTNTDFYPYQFKPVLRFLNSPSNALLIADEVGLGKTIEAGLIWTELRSRYDLRRLVVLCPAMLKEKWERELRTKIGVKAEQVNAAELLKRLRDPMADRDGFALICSQAGIRPPRGWNDPDAPSTSAAAKLACYLRDQESAEPLIDLLVVDEAHYLRNPESQTYASVNLLRPVVEHLLFLTATPIHNRNRDLFSLLRLMDGATFSRMDDLELILQASRPLVEARDHLLQPNPSIDTLHEKLQVAADHPLLEGNRQIAAAQQQLNRNGCIGDTKSRTELARRLETVNPLAYVITRTRKRDVQEWRVVRDPRPEAVRMTPVEQDFYQKVTDFVIDYAMQRDVNERFILATPQRQVSSCMAGALRAWRQKRDNLDEAESIDQGEAMRAKLGPLISALLEKVDDFGEIDELTQHDSKCKRLREILRANFEKHPGEKVVLFSSFQETLNYLAEQLEAWGIKPLVLHGGVTRTTKQTKDQILSRFQEDPSIQVLLSSEVGSEGIDLQFCRILINYDLPWNPMRVEQRIGRLDRLGQTADRILIWNLMSAETIDARIYTRLYDKLDLCRQALGDFESVLGDEIRSLTVALLSDHLTPEQQEARIDQTEQALENLKKEGEELEREASHLVAYGDYILQQVHAAKELNRQILGPDLRTYVIDYLKAYQPGCRIQQYSGSELEYGLRLTPNLQQDLEDYIRDRRLHTFTRLTRGAASEVPCRFENRTQSAAGERSELINQFHPLVRFISDDISERAEQLRPAVAITMPRSVVPKVSLESGDYLVAASRWSVSGLQANEKLVFAATPLFAAEALDAQTAERLANAAAQHGIRWHEAVQHVDLVAAAALADERLFARLQTEYEDYVADIKRQNEDRADLQIRNLHRHRDQQRNQLDSIRQEHASRGRTSLIKATEGRIQAMENRFERRERAVEKGRRLISSDEEVFAALVHLTPA